MTISKNRAIHFLFGWYSWSYYALPFRTHM